MTLDDQSCQQETFTTGGDEVSEVLPGGGVLLGGGVDTTHLGDAVGQKKRMSYRTPHEGSDDEEEEGSEPSDDGSSEEDQDGRSEDLGKLHTQQNI